MSADNGANDMVTHELRPRALLAADGGGMTDGQLLARFLAQRDEAAFESVVRRHGPMVLGVCRRVLRHPQDAEDAFQATFLVLVKKAASIAQRELLANWLYGVAYRTALDARAAALRRQTRERQVSPMPEPPADAKDPGADLRPILDQELNRLADRYRVPVVLCDLHGRTRRDVARQLGIPVGTLSGRLTVARRLLARRLARYGLGFSAGALATAAMPEALVSSTVHAATAMAAGRAATGVASAPVAALVEGVLKALWLKSLKITATLLLAAGVVLGVGVLLMQKAQKSNDPTAPRVVQLGSRGRQVVWSPDGKTLAVTTINESLFQRKGSAVRLWDTATGQLRQTLAEDSGGGLAFQGVAFSPDGKWIGITATEEVVTPGSREIRDVIKLHDAKTGTLQQTLVGTGHLHLGCLAFSPDSRRLAAGDPGAESITLWKLPSGALERTVKVQAQPWSVAFAPDGKALVVGGQKADHSGRVQLWDTKGWTVKYTWKPGRYVNQVVFSPDGTMIAGCSGGAEIVVWDARKGKEIASLKGNPRGHRALAFSPNGKLLAAGAPDGRVWLWEMPTGRLKRTLEGHDDEIRGLAFSPDGRTLASSSQDETIRLWPMNP